MVLDFSGLGQVSPASNGGEVPQAEIIRVDIAHHRGIDTIWEDGQIVIPKLEVTSGKGWEVHVYYKFYSATGNYSAWVTIVSSVGSQKLGHGYGTGGREYKDNLNFNMGVMPESNVVVNRIKIFTSNAVGWRGPDKSLW